MVICPLLVILATAFISLLYGLFSLLSSRVVSSTLVRMTWQEIRELHPQQWLLLEVLEAESQAQTRFLKNLAVNRAFQ